MVHIRRTEKLADHGNHLQQTNPAEIYNPNICAKELSHLKEPQQRVESI